VRPNPLADQRTLLVSGLYFVLERIDLAPSSHWCLEAKRETWLLVLSGAAAGSLDVARADAVFAQLHHAGRTAQQLPCISQPQPQVYTSSFSANWRNGWPMSDSATTAAA
jgi:hypothetical protein